MFSISRIIPSLVSIMISLALAPPLYAQQLLPGMDLQTARADTDGRYTFSELAGASNAISNDASAYFSSRRGMR